MNTRPACLRVIVAACAAALLLGQSACQQPGTIDLNREIDKLRTELRERDNRIAALESTVQSLNKQLASARGLTDEDLKHIYFPEQIVIGKLSGGEDYDGEPGDDGVTVYIQPTDRTGDVLKVVGAIRVELFDLQAAEGAKLVGECIVPAEKASEHWHGQLMTYHYSIRCAWKNGPPKHDEITIRVTFVDYLSERVITAQAVRSVRLPISAG